MPPLLIGLFFVLVSSRFSVSEEHEECCCQDTVEVDNYNRLIVYINAKSSPATFSDVVDVNNTQWKALGIHPPYFFPVFRESTFVYFYKQYGLNFPTGIYNPALDSYTLLNGSGVPYVTLIPYKLQFPTYRLTIDSQNTERGPEGWNIWNFGYIATFLQPGRFTSGVANNTTFAANNIISYTIKHLLKIDGDWQTPCDIELMLGYSPNPAMQPVNSQGFTDQLIFEEIIPCEDRTYLNSVKDCHAPQVWNLSRHTHL